MPRPPITPQQAAEVDRILARHQDYLRRLKKRLAAVVPYEYRHVPGWAGQAEWAVGGLRIHFASWANGQQAGGYPKNPQDPTTIPSDKV